MSKLTIVLLIKGRENFTKRWLDYMSKINYQENILIGDGDPKTKIKNVITPTAIPNPSFPNNLIATLVANADAPTLTKLLPRLTLDIIQLGFIFNLCNAFEPFSPSLNN